MKKILIRKQIYDVITTEEYIRKKNLNPEATEDLSTEIAIEKEGYVYPIVSPNESETNMIGVQDYNAVLLFNKPKTDKDKKLYSKDNILDFDHTDNLKDMIQKRAQLESMERSLLIDKDNIYNIFINENDTPEFVLLKEAINKKQIDINSYRNRFSDSFSNNMRLLTNSNSITFGKLKAFANVFDMDIELTIKDKPGCVNPIGEVLNTTIT